MERRRGRRVGGDAVSSNACVSASAVTNVATTCSRAARARAAATIASEMSTPRQFAAPSSRFATATVVPPVPQPTSKIRRGAAWVTKSHSSASMGAKSPSITS